jgi:hypothetical protein
MARARRRVALALVAAGLAFAAPAAAQGLRTLQVDALGMHADRTHLSVGEVFHLAIHVRVRQRVAALDELVVPNVGTMQLEGDERHVTGSPAGTDVVETLTLEPTAAGTYTFNPAYLDAIDARTGKPTRFSANPVRVVVDPPALSYPSPPGLSRNLREIVVAGAALVTVVIVAIALFRMNRRRAAAPVPAAPPPAVQQVPLRTPRDEVTDALRAYRSAPANGSLIRLRGALFAAAGAQPGATLRDAFAVTQDVPLRAALGAAERTAFGPAYLRDASSVDLIDASQAWLG